MQVNKTMTENNSGSMNWKMVKLDELCIMNSGGTPRRSNLSFYNGTIPWAKISDIENAEGGIINSTEEHISNEGLSSINNRIFQKGTLLLAMYGSVGKVAFAGLEMTTNQAILGIKIKDERLLNYSYLKYWFQTIKQQLLNRAVGGTLQNISLGIVKDLQVPLPPLATQKRIAEILDAADALRRKDQEILKKYDELAQSIFIDMFGDPVKNEKGWEVKKLGDVAIFPSGLIDPKSEKYKYLFHVGGDNIDGKNGRIFGLKKAKDLGLISGKFYFTHNHILYNKIRPYLNKVALPDFEGICSADMYPILPVEEKILKEYLYFILRSPFFLDFADKQSRRANIPKINMTEMSIFELPVPPIDMQRIFISNFNTINIKINNIHTIMTLSNDLFNSLIQQAFKGELVS